MNSRQRSLYLALALLAVASCTSAITAQQSASPASADWLISPAESHGLDQDKASSDLIPPQTRTRGGDQAVLNDGPQVEVINPSAGQVSSPLEIHIRFHAASAAVDIGSLEIHVQKWVLGAFHGNLDLSPRLQPYLSGNELHVPQQNIPKGRYKLTYVIKDMNGQRTTGAIVLEVS
jgi:hypothetical protein